jgi:oligoendopeptidase F
MNGPTKWNLARYFYTGLDDPQLKSDIQRILPDTQAFADKYRSRMAGFTLPEELLEFYADYTTLSYNIAKPSYYLFYRSSLDTQDLEVTKKSGEVDFIYTEASNLLLFVAQGWKSIGYERIMTWSEDPKLRAYKNDLISTADGIKYILSEKEERVLNLKSRPLALGNALHDELTGSYEFQMNI